jgi:KUP system potassium uptake protein
VKELESRLEPAAADAPEEDRGGLLRLAVTALGVVYGDIGTSPLYALRECFRSDQGVEPSPANVFGVVSLVFWSLVIVVSVKYLVYVLRADNRGEGGILALMALVHPGDARVARSRRRTWAVVAMGLFGAALLYADGSITPAISVLSAVEGLEVATPAFAPWVLPISVVILVLLFGFQHRGTGGVGGVFGPTMLVWFGVLAALGVGGIARRPEILGALAPRYGAAFLAGNGFVGFGVLGAVFLVVTGGEALYADVGHFGRRPIRVAWFALVLPALVVNYLGQGALLLEHPHTTRSPFYLLAPDWARYPLVALATIATVIASQAVISGAFSLTRQAIQLGYCPRLRIEHTSSEHIGQVYVPAVNWALMLLTVGLVLGFGSSANLAAAYGLAVSTTMVITTLLAYVVAVQCWRWRPAVAALVTVLFLVVDCAFLGANLVKFVHGGWFPVAFASIIYLLMSTWEKGKRLVRAREIEQRIPLETFLHSLEAEPPLRVAGTAVFLTGGVGTPMALVHHLEHNRVLHERVIVLTVVARSVPSVPSAERVQCERLPLGFWRVTAAFGFKEVPRVVPILHRVARESEIGELDPNQISFYVGREVPIPVEHVGMSVWRSRLFAFMSQNALRVSSYLHCPHTRVIELGVEVEL